MKRGPRGRAIAVAAAALSLAALVLAVVLPSWWLAPLAGRYFSHTSGRTVHFDTLEFGLSSRFEPLLTARGVFIENAAWADSAQPMAVIREVSAEFVWSSLLKTPKRVSRLVLRDAVVDLERQADGLCNWRLRKPQDRGPGAYRVRTLEAERSDIRFINGGLALDMRFKTRANDDPAVQGGAEPHLPTRVDFSGTFRAIPFSGTAATTDAVSFYETGRLLPFQGQLKAGGATIELTGQLADVLGAVGIDADVAVAGASLAPFAGLIGERGRELHGFSLKSHVKGRANEYSAQDFDLHLGASDLSGQGRYAQDDKRTLVQGSFHSERVDVDELAALATPRSKPDAGGLLPGVHRGEHGPLQMELVYDARHLRFTRIAALQSLRLHATTNGDVLTLPEFDLGLADGHARGRLELDQGKSPPRAAATVAWNDLHLETLIPPRPPQRRISGILHGNARLESSGDTLEALTKALSGTASMTLASGEIASLLDAEIGLQGGRILRNLITGSRPIPIDCASIVLAAENGAGSIRKLVLDTELGRTTGTGSIDLPEKTLDIVLTSEAKRPSLLVLDKSIRLHGPWRKPDRSLIARAPLSEESCRTLKASGQSNPG